MCALYRVRSCIVRGAYVCLVDVLDAICVGLYMSKYGAFRLVGPICATGFQRHRSASQEMLEFCGRHNIVCDVEKIGADQVRRLS